MAEDAADFDTGEVNEANDSSTGEAAGDAAADYAQAEQNASTTETDAARAEAKRARTALNDAQAANIAQLAPDGVDSAAVADAATRANEGVQSAESLTDARNKGDTAEQSADPGEAKANKALSEMQARLGELMKEGVDKKANKTLSKSNYSRWRSLMDTHETAVENLANALKGDSPGEVEDAETKANASADALDKLLEEPSNKDFKTELDASEGSIEWAKWGKLLGVLGGLGGLFALCWWIAKQKTGCYLYKSGDKNKLDSFGDASCQATNKKPDVESDCSCQVDGSGTTHDKICGSTPDPTNKNAQYPMCCNGDNGGQPPCNVTSDAKTTIYYGYNKYNALDVMSSPITSIPNLFKDLGNGIGDLLKTVLKWVLIAAAICAAVGFLFFIGKIIFARLMAPKEHENVEEPRQEPGGYGEGRGGYGEGRGGYGEGRGGYGEGPQGGYAGGPPSRQMSGER